MPVSRNYSGGSIVYFQGDRGDDIYVLQKGRVILTSTALDTGEEVKQDVQKGEFFGLKSSLGRYPRDETAQVLGSTNLLVFKQAEFEQLVLKNTRLIMKTLKVFSRQLRDVHRQVREILKQGAAREPSFELVNVAESFYKDGSIDHAVYALQKYLEYYPGGSFSDRVKDLLQKARKGEGYPLGYPELEQEAQGMGGDDDGFDFTAEGMSPAADALDDPFALDAGGPAEAPAAPAAAKGASDLLYEGIDLFAREEYDACVRVFDQALGVTKLTNQDDANAYAQAHYEKARALIKLEKYDDATTILSTYLKKYPTGDYMKQAILQLGISAEAQGNTERAKSLYKKVTTMQPPDSTSAEARKRLDKLG